MCEYKNTRKENLAKHYALFHCKLDELMMDTALVHKKREQVLNKPKKLSMGEMCVICHMMSPSREHVATKHFMKELMEIVSTFENPRACELGAETGGCDYTTTEAEYTCRHIALVHCKLEEFLQDGEVIKEKVLLLANITCLYMNFCCIQWCARPYDGAYLR